MTLRVQYKKKSNGVTGNSGHFYSFRYSAFENDPNPTYFHLYSFSGTHPKTGRQWRFNQGININYLPRKDRKQFVKIGRKEFEKNNNPKVTGEKIKTKYPYLQNYLRRYFYTPAYYIKSAKEIPPEDGDKEVVRSLIKDFSKKIRRKIASRFKKRVVGKRR